MSKKKICLFSAMSPMGGGGSVSLRSMVANLPEFDISWQYTADKVTPGYEQGYMGRGFMGGSVVTDIVETWKMLADKPSEKIDAMLNHLLSIDCDGYWIVSLNEGLRVAVELSRRQKNRFVHMSLHDDWAGALCARSVRYRFLGGLAYKMTKLALQQVASFDVTSRGMRTYYKQLSGRDSGVTHRYITAQSVTTAADYQDNADKITVGHIGSLYTKEDFFKFLNVLKAFASRKNKLPEVHMWGCHLDPAAIPADLRKMVYFHKTLPEEQVIPELARCTLTYAMYPMTERLRIFTQTSMQTKLASYIQARRPIFGQGPTGSSLAEYMDNTNTGKLWDGAQQEEGINILNELLELKPGISQWQYAREQYFGEDNIEVVRQGLLNLV